MKVTLLKNKINKLRFATRVSAIYRRCVLKCLKRKVYTWLCKLTRFVIDYVRAKNKIKINSKLHKITNTLDYIFCIGPWAQMYWVRVPQQAVGTLPTEDHTTSVGVNPFAITALLRQLLFQLMCNAQMQESFRQTKV